ncbi:MAG: efflux RND transporter periplasmic adaptor subunit [Thalassotalea sp.]|nr:efflux RND transporter periplasmic adaptor subunit [Thalassotalea sp.]
MMFKKKILPFVVLGGFIALAMIVTNNPPETKRGKPSMAPQLNVEVQTISHQPFTVYIDSYGNVRPRTQSALQPQVSGEITSISQNFREGGFFEKGEVLVKLDDRDYVAEIDIAKANLFSAKQALAEEQARVEQAKQDWERLGNSGEPSDLVLRKPQLLAAESSVFSAQASLAKAELALERTQIKAPYTGRVLAKSVDIGQYVSQSTQLATVYAVDYVEVRLPIKNKDLPFITLPETTRVQRDKPLVEPEVSIYSKLVNTQSWQGKVVRTEGAFDDDSQQLFVVGQIDDPYGEQLNQGLPLKIGQYVSAKITGKTLQNAITIPNKAIYQGSYVFTVLDNKLLRQEISLAWQNREYALVADGLNAGDLLVLTPLGQVNSGTPIAISNKDGKQMKAQQRGPRPDKIKGKGKGEKGKQGEVGKRPNRDGAKEDKRSVANASQGANS